MKYLRSFFLLWAVLFAAMAAGKSAKHTFQIQNGSFVYDGKVTPIYAGEMHFSRVPAPYWRHRLKMIKAMGLNAVSTYVFWNFHEVAPGQWDWKTDRHNIRQFIKLAQEEGLMVILRAGPYSCAEWDFGGYPWWLLQTPGLVVRQNNELFLDSCRVYLRQLAAQTKDLQVTHGGPIVMMQAENEFGSYVAQRKDIPLEEHKKYSAAILQAYRDAGFDVPFFTSDGSWLLEGGTIPGAMPTANGENDIDNLKKLINQYNDGHGPYMVTEFYPGWLDHWNEPFVKVPTERVTTQAEKYLENGVSFCFYMAHGGTSFGFCSGANFNTDNNIQPDITSYDFDAPISEAGWATDKYMAIRDVMKKHVQYAIPDVPERIPVISIDDINLARTADVISQLTSQQPVESDQPLTFEQLNQGCGYVLYRRHFNQPITGWMRVPGIADFATVYVNGKKVGTLNRLVERDSLLVDIPFNCNLDILVENCGHINYGVRITQNHKGILQPITINDNPISGEWKMYGLPMTSMPDIEAMPLDYQEGMPVLYSGTFQLDEVGDTFLDMEKWGKGIVFVNGHNLGRYWKVGPQQTLYLPGCWLRKGKNQVVVFEQLNDHRQSTLSGITTPILDKLGEKEEVQQETPEQIIARQAKQISTLQQEINALKAEIEKLQK